MKFETLIHRIDENVLQQLFGESLQIINGVGENNVTIESLKDALLVTYSPFQILTNKNLFKPIIPIISKEDAIRLCQELGIQFDENIPWTSLEKLNLSTSVGRRLCNYFDVEYEDFVKEIIPNQISIAPEYPLFSHQIKVQNKVENKLWGEGKRKVLIHMPTGSGKTRTCMNIICDYFRKHEKSNVIWFANTEELCQQASDEFCKAWKELGNRKLSVQNIWGGNKLNHELKSSFIVFGIQSFISLYSNNSSIATRLSESVGLVVMDEAHMSIAPKYKLGLDILLFKNAKLIGLSATPGRSWNNKNADRELADYYEREKVTLEIQGFNNPVDFLISKGYLARVNNESLLFNDGLSPTEEDYEYLRENLQLSQKILNRISEDAKRNILIVSKVVSLLRKHNRIILFAINVKHSEVLALALSSLGIRACSISSKTEKSVRRNLISEFKKEGNDQMVLCNYGVLTTGFDAPKTSCAVITRPTDSLVLYSQMVGRVIRGVEAGGNEVADVITVVDTNLKGFGNISDAFFNWEDVW